MKLFGDNFELGILLNPIGSIVEGIMGGHAASTAAGVQNNTAQGNANDIIKTAQQVNPTITGAASDAAAGAKSAASDAAAGATGAASDAATAATAAADKAAGGVSTAATTANNGLNPYAAAGTTAADQLNKVAANGNQQPTLSQLQISPAYQFQLQQGLAALNRSAAATGGALSGGAIKGADSFAQGLAGTAYQNAFNDFETAQQNNVSNLLGISGQGQTAATTQGNNTLNASIYGGNTGINAAQYGGNANMNAAQYGGNLNVNAAQYGGNANMNAANLAASNTINAGNNAAQYRMVGANDQASGIIGKANAYSGGITGALNGLTGMAAGGAFGSGVQSTLGSYLANPAVQSGGLPLYNQVQLPNPYAG
jgi:hypothetical protein